MRKLKIKILSCILTFMLLINTILPVAKAVLAPAEENINLEEPYEIITEDEVIRTGVYMILGLEYEVYDASQAPENLTTPKTGKAYKANDFIKVKLRIKEKKNFEKVVSFLYYIHYDKEALKLENIECSKPGYTDNSELERGYIAYQFGGSSANATMDDVVTEFVFKAKKDSNPDTPTTISIYDGDFSDKDMNNAVEAIGNINTPQLTLPEPNSEEPAITHGIEITKVDGDNNPITTSNAIYQITTPNDETKLVQTNEGRAKADGKLLLEGLPMPTGALDNTYNYVIVEKSAPEGYVLDKTPKTLKVKFADNGTIQEAKLDGAIQNIRENNIIELKFLNQKEVQKPKDKVTFVINKKDEEGNLITTDEASFGLEVASGDIRYVTTTSGTVAKTLEIPEDITNPIEYKINEISAPEGYVLDGQDIKFKVNYNKNDDATVNVASVTKVSGTNATISKSGNTITIDIVNEKIKPQEKFQIQVTKVDEEGNPITNSATFLVTTPAGTQQIGQTGTNGRIIIQANIPQDDVGAEGYIYKIQEIKAPSGYKLNEDEISVALTFQDVEGVKKLTSAEVTGAQVTKEAISDNTLPLNIINKKEPENFTITLNKTNEEGSIIAKSDVYFKLTKPNGEVASLQTDATGKVIYTGKMPETEKEETYKLQEIVAPAGYVLNSNEQEIKLNFKKVSGVMKLFSATVVDPISKVGDITNNNLIINFKNEIEVPVVPRTQFDLSVTKVDKETGNSITRRISNIPIIK